MELNKYIDHTNLNMAATKEDIKKLCDEAKQYNFAAVCIHPYYIEYAKDLLKDSNIEIATVIGFPLGMNITAVKEYEAIAAIESGATEIDMVMNVAALKNKDYEYIKKEIEDIRNAIDGQTLKIIIETRYLTKEEIIKMTEICNQTFVNFIKTSTGFGLEGAKVEDIKLIKQYANDILEIKASGGIKSTEEAMKMIEAGANRIGTSHGVDILKGVIK